MDATAVTWKAVAAPVAATDAQQPNAVLPVRGHGVAEMPRAWWCKGLAQGAAWLAYTGLIVWCCIQREPRWWAVLPFVLPMFYWAGGYLYQRARHSHVHKFLLGGLLLALAGLLAGLAQMQAVMVSPQHVRWFYFAQEALVLWLLVVLFARSLLPGRVPLCSAVAMLCHPVMTPVLWRYTRGVTLAWVVWLAALWLASALLFVLASAQIWMSFVFVVSPALMAAFFLAEVFVGRRIFLPKSDRSSLSATVATLRRVNWVEFARQMRSFPAAESSGRQGTDSYTGWC